MAKLIQTSFVLILILLANSASANDCDVRYKRESGDVVMPCVMDDYENHYIVLMQRKNDGDFQVTYLDKFDKPQLPAELQKAELIAENLLLVMVNYIIPAGSCPRVAEKFSTAHYYLDPGNDNKILIKILQNSFHTITCGLNPERPVTTAQVIKVSPGTIYDIHINGELKETVEVPALIVKTK